MEQNPVPKARQVAYYLIYGSALAGMLYILRWLEIRLIIIRHSFEIYAAAIAILFLLLGIWIASKILAPKTIVIEKPVLTPAEFIFNQSEFERLGLTKREYEVLTLMAKGMSNIEIASELFVSESTVKSHAAKLFEKLDVKRRTQAVDKAKQISLLP